MSPVARTQNTPTFTATIPFQHPKTQWSVDGSRDPIAALLSDLQQDADAAFSELHSRTHARLHAAVLKVVRSPDCVADVMQEAYLDIWLHRASGVSLRRVYVCG